MAHRQKFRVGDIVGFPSWEEYWRWNPIILKINKVERYGDSITYRVSHWNQRDRCWKPGTGEGSDFFQSTSQFDNEMVRLNRLALLVRYGVT